MKKSIFIIMFLSLIVAINLTNILLYKLTLSPDTIITNNNIVNYYDTINKINNEISEDNYNYTFKKEKIHEDINNFKNTFIETLNDYITKKSYNKAKQYLNTYIQLFSDDAQVLAINNYLENTIKNLTLVEYNGPIEVLSFNPLIAYPKLVLNEKNSSALKLDENNITTTEFEKILNSLYEKNYILISPLLLSDNTKLMLPSNKKPLLCILEDIGYNSKLNGCVDKLIIDNNDNIASYTPKRSINDRIQRDNDFITILNNFVNTHPSFSLNNAKALIVVDGSRGIFGYNTQKTNATSKYEIKKAIEIINNLKNNGYYFASEGYNATIKDSSVTFAGGLNTWNNELAPILGETNIFFLNTNIASIDGDISYQANLLKTYNYKLIIGLDMTSKYEFNEKLKLKYITAKQINGKTLRYSQDQLSHLFDCEKIYDHINRHIPFNI